MSLKDGTSPDEKIYWWKGELLVQLTAASKGVKVTHFLSTYFFMRRGDMECSYNNSSDT